MTDSTMSLEEKLRAILSEDDTGQGPIGQCGKRPLWANPVGDRWLSETEMDLRDWGCIYGMAFGIARHEEPFESIAQVSERALDVAWKVYRDWGTQITEPARGGPRAEALA